MTAGPAPTTRCNIGADEVARRRRTAIFTSILFLVIVVAIVGLDVPALARLLLWPVATAVGVTWLQVTSRFCVAYGAFGFENFGRLGRQVRVEGPQRAADRRRAFLLILEGAVIGFALTLAVIPLRL